MTTAHIRTPQLCRSTGRARVAPHASGSRPHAGFASPLNDVGICTTCSQLAPVARPSETRANGGTYQLRHTFATEALAADISIFERARGMGASVKTIDKHYGHLARDSEQAIRARLDARAEHNATRVGTKDGSELRRRTPPM